MPTKWPESVTASFFMFCLTISRMACSIEELGFIVISGFVIMSLVFVDSGFLFSATTLFRMSLSVTIPTGLSFCVIINELIS